MKPKQAVDALEKAVLSESSSSKGFGSLIEDVHVGAIREKSMALPAGDFVENADSLHMIYSGGDSGKGRSGLLLAIIGQRIFLDRRC